VARGENKLAGNVGFLGPRWSTPQVDRVGPALEWSVNMADMAARITGIPTNLCTNEHGPFGELAWIATYADLAEVDQASEALTRDGDYVKQLGRTTGYFVPGSGVRVVGIRI
jgi:hypothetical protein